MTRFTNSPLEKLMQQIPRVERREKPVAPPGHPCRGCVNYGQGCIAPCYRDLLRCLSENRAK